MDFLHTVPQDSGVLFYIDWCMASLLHHFRVMWCNAFPLFLSSLQGRFSLLDENLYHRTQTHNYKGPTLLDAGHVNSSQMIFSLSYTIASLSLWSPCETEWSSSCGQQLFSPTTHPTVLKKSYILSLLFIGVRKALWLC